MYTCKYLDQIIIDDLFHMESQGAKGFLARQIGRYLQGLDEHLSAIDTGINNRDFDTIREHAHKINGFSGTLGIKSIRSLSVQIESESIMRENSKLPDLLKQLKAEIKVVKPELEEIARISKSHLENIKSK